MSHSGELELFLSRADAPQRTIDDQFEAWWRQYPRRVAKGATRKAFKRVLVQKLASPEQLFAGVARYGAERDGEDPAFTKHPATWLNGECWLDEPKPRHRKPTSRADSAIEGMMSDLTDEDFRR